MVIGIIGGGASGMVAAIAASFNPDANVLLFERQARLGRKLQATGNGRCNLTNLNTSLNHYHGEDPKFVLPAFSRLDVEKTLALFRDLGLFTVAEDTGKVYPYSDQANSVVDVLRFALNKDNISVFTGCEVISVTQSDKGFEVHSQEKSYHCDKLIVACGGLAGTKLGGGMSGYKLLNKFGHKSTKLRPSLVQIKTKWPAIVALKGVRAQCRAEIYCDEKLHSFSTGELQFTEYGISGPVIFEISRDVCVSRGDWVCKFDFAPDFTEEELYLALKQRKNTDLVTDELLTGILHNRLGRVIVKDAGVSSGIKISQLSDKQIIDVCKAIKSFEIQLDAPLGMDSAQVTAGGVLTDGFDPKTMESKRIPKLYACGEVLDIDGDCGGYNLQWAWSSGYCAGISAGEVML